MLRGINCLPLKAGFPLRQRGKRESVIVSSAEDDQPPPFTRLSVPVYSLSTLPGVEGSGTPSDPQKAAIYNAFPEPRPSLNITTYTSPVAIKPERMYSLGLYVGTMSWRNVRQTRKAVLQILTRDHLNPALFEILGRRSARNVSKLPMIKEYSKLIDWKGYPVFENAFGVMLLEVVSDFTPCGDHEVVLCRVSDWETFNEGKAPLYTGDLRAEGLIP